MSHYIHHVPGRLRVRSRSFHCKPQQLQSFADQLMTIPGVETVDVNQKAASVTVRYQPMTLNQETLLKEFQQAGCFEITKHDPRQNLPVGELAQKALFGTLVQLTVERSVRSLVGALL
jgi:Heavy metal associated domain 2